MTWPKNQIRLGGGSLPSVRRNIGATSPIIRPKIVWPRAAATLKELAVTAATTLKEPAVIAATRKEPAVTAATTLKEPAVAAATRKEPAIAATTTCHQQLLGKLPHRPSTKRKVRQVAAMQPQPSNF
jgi:hypothetical protein